MAQAPGGCDFCGKSIPPSDFQSGQAVVLLKKAFCRDCMARAVKSGKRGKSKGSSKHRSLTPKTLQVNLPRVHPMLRLGEHACSLYRTEEERRSQVASFLCDGIRNGEKIFYAVDDSSSERVLEYLKGAGINTAALLRSGQLEIYPTTNVYAPSGSFDAGQMLTRVKMIVDRVLKEGYPGVRASGEATWALRGWPGSEKLAEYELRLNALFPALRCAALCQYDVTRFKPALLNNLKATHPVVLAPRLS